jgi:hypothetical protein
VTLNIVLIGLWLTLTAPCFYKEHRCATGLKEYKIFPLQAILGLSAAQWSVVEPRIMAFHDSSAILYKEIADNRTRLVDELEKPLPDSAVLAGCGERISEGQIRMQRLAINHILSEKTYLTSEQQHCFFSEIRNNMLFSLEPGAIATVPVGNNGSDSAHCTNKR